MNCWTELGGRERQEDSIEYGEQGKLIEGDPAGAGKGEVKGEVVQWRKEDGEEGGERGDGERKAVSMHNTPYRNDHDGDGELSDVT